MNLNLSSKISVTQLGAKLSKEMAEDNENSRRASALIRMLRSSGKTYEEIAKQLNAAGFKTPRGTDFRRMQVQRLYERIIAVRQIDGF